MELVLRKRSSDEALRLSGAKVLCRNSRKLALLAPYAGQWVFYSLSSQGSTHILYNRLPAPARCSVTVGDLLNLNGLELIVDSVEGDAGAFPVQRADPAPCEIKVAGEKSIRATQDLFIGHDPCCGLCVGATFEGQPLIALLTFAVGCWHLHDLTGNSLVCNGKPSGTSRVLADGDRVLLHDKVLVFRLGIAAGAGGGAPPPKLPDERGKTHERRMASADTAEKPAVATQEIDLVYRKAKQLCQELLPILQEPGRKPRPRKAPGGRIRNWLRIFRRPTSPVETLERLQFLLSGSPRDRVWLLELARFLFQQSYHGLCLRVLKELYRLYSHDVVVTQTLARFYYQQGRNTGLPASGRRNALEHADRCLRLVRRLAPQDRSLADLASAIHEEQTLLPKDPAEAAPGQTALPERVEVMGRKG